MQYKITKTETNRNFATEGYGEVKLRRQIDVTITHEPSGHAETYGVLCELRSESFDFWVKEVDLPSPTTEHTLHAQAVTELVEDHFGA